MSRPSPLSSQVSNDSGHTSTLEEKQKLEELSMVISGDFAAVDSDRVGRQPLLSSIWKEEPIVTRRELWSYYRQSYSFLSSSASHLKNFFKSVLQRQ